jgi:hypothetical protein
MWMWYLECMTDLTDVVKKVINVTLFTFLILFLNIYDLQKILYLIFAGRNFPAVVLLTLEMSLSYI